MIVQERWDHRADLAEQAIEERHSARLWGLPLTNLGLIAWPPTSRDRLFVRWHYWWQAHYIDNLVDASLRRPTKARQADIRRTLRAMRIRNLRRLSRNSYYDDKAWLALAMGRVGQLDKMATPRGYEELVENIFQGIDGLTGVLPWRTSETFYNVPTNGPAAILATRVGRLDIAEHILDWIFTHLINEDGLVMDGLRMRMHGPEVEPAVYSYCQGVVLGACVELAIAQRDAAGVDRDAVSEVGMTSITRARGLIEAIARTHINADGVLDWPSFGGDGGLFNGILMRYLALAATSLPSSRRRGEEAQRTARDIVKRTAESAWRYRLEVDGLPVFPAEWTRDAMMPQSGGLVGATIAGAVASSDIAERDLSVQLGGWMLMEAMCRVVRDESDHEN
ncbi:glycoside hydrolase family 76 protein [Corynebacterium auriscanis]|uniref:glycoside hydrolase family 76 protein n=1 Tax=Corynebacterium auriscanis TaxID=99807 RepID=UPI003CF29FC0